MTKGEEARAIFESGCANCAQAVLCAFAKEVGTDTETLARVASGFGGGMGRLRGQCGAVSGMCMAAGLLRGHGLAGEDGDKAATYRMTQELIAAFREKHGSTVCRELLGGNPSTDPTPTPRTAEFYRTRPCGGYIADAAEILDAYLKRTAR